MAVKTDYFSYIESVGGVVVREDNQYLICEHNGFLFKVYKRHVRNKTFSFIGDFRACIDKVGYFKYYMEIHCKHKNLSFKNSVFTGVREQVEVECNEHGVFTTTASLLIDRGSGCAKCYNKYQKHKVKNKGLVLFVKQATERFEGKFDYSETLYRNTMTKVKIKCPTHGVFEQTPHEHLKAIYGCPHCYSVYNSFRLEDYEKICPDGSNLYAITLFNKDETFFKIGISKDIEHRFKSFKQAGFEIGENIIFFDKDAGLIFAIEDDLLSYYQSDKYIPKTKFAGWTECFSHISFEYIAEMVYSLKNIRCSAEMAW